MALQLKSNLDVLQYKSTKFGGVVMLDFKEELTKYKRVMEVDQVADALTDEIEDIMDLLQQLISEDKPLKEASSE